MDASKTPRLTCNRFKKQEKHCRASTSIISDTRVSSTTPITPRWWDQNNGGIEEATELKSRASYPNGVVGDDY